MKSNTVSATPSCRTLTTKLSGPARRERAMRTQKARRRAGSAGRVRGRCYHRPLPSEPDLRVSSHPAQAFTNASWQDAASPPVTVKRLHDTGLGSASSPEPGLFGPVFKDARGRTSEPFGHRHLLFPLNRLVKRSRDGRPGGSQPAFAGDDVACAQPLSIRLQDGIRFLLPPFPAALSTHLTVGFPLREDDGVTAFRMMTPTG